MSYWGTYDRVTTLLEQLSSNSRRFLRFGAKRMLEKICYRDIDERTMMECVATVKPLKVIAEDKNENQKFDIQWPTSGMIKQFLANIIKE